MVVLCAESVFAQCNTFNPVRQTTGDWNSSGYWINGGNYVRMSNDLNWWVQPTIYQTIYGVSPRSNILVDVNWGNGQGVQGTRGNQLIVDVSYNGVAYARFTTSPFYAGDQGAGAVSPLNGATVTTISGNMRAYTGTRLSINLPANIPSIGALMLTAYRGENSTRDGATDDFTFGALSVNTTGVCLEKQTTGGATPSGTFNFTTTNLDTNILTNGVENAASITAGTTAVVYDSANGTYASSQPMMIVNPAAGVTITESPAGAWRLKNITCDIGTLTVAGNTATLTNIPLGSIPTCRFVNGYTDLIITKSHTGNFTLGANGAYTFTVKNQGGETTSGAIGVSDTLPTGLTVNNGAAGAVTLSGTNAASWTCNSNASTPQTITCTTNATLAANASHVFTITTRVGLNTAVGTNSITNRATVSGGSETVTTNNFDDDPTTVLGPLLGVTKSAPNPKLQVGRNSVYTISVRNTGTASATSATITDAIPVGLDLISVSGTNWTCTPNSGTSPVGTITCTYTGTIAINASTPNLSLTVGPVAGTEGTIVTNYVSVHPRGGTTPPAAPTCTAANTPTLGCGKPVPSPVITGISLKAAKTVSAAKFIIGDDYTYDIVVTNDGIQDATSATIADAIPAGLSLISVSGTNWTCTPNSGTSPVGTISCTYANTVTANGGTAATLTLRVRPVSGAGTTVTNHVSVDDDGGNSPPSPPSCTGEDSPSLGCGEPVETPIINGYDLKVVKGQPTPALTVGANSVYAISLTNNGVKNATTATIAEAIPAGLDLISVSGTGWTCTPNSGTDPVGTINCTYTGTITAGGGTAPNLNLTVKPKKLLGGTTVTNYVSVDPDGTTNPPNPATCTDLDTPTKGCGTPVESPVDKGIKLSIAKGNPTPALEPGKNSTYTITVTNNGTGDADSATVSETLPVGLNLEDATGTNWTCTPRIDPSPATPVVCTFSGTLAANGGTTQITIKVKPITASAGTTVINYVSVDPSGGTNPPLAPTCTGLNTPSAGCGAPVESVIPTSPNIGLTKTCISPTDCITATQRPGTDLTWQIDAKNTGQLDANSFVLEDKIPVYTDFRVGSAVFIGTGFTAIIEYSNDDGNTWTYAPISGGGGATAGYDRNVTHIRWTVTPGIAENKTITARFMSKIQ